MKLKPNINLKSMNEIKPKFSLKMAVSNLNQNLKENRTNPRRLKFQIKHKTINENPKT